MTLRHTSIPIAKQRFRVWYAIMSFTDASQRWVERCRRGKRRLNRTLSWRTLHSQGYRTCPCRTGWSFGPVPPDWIAFPTTWRHCQAPPGRLYRRRWCRTHGSSRASSPAYTTDRHVDIRFLVSANARRLAQSCPWVHFPMTRPDPTHQLRHRTRTNFSQIEKFGPNPT